MPADGSGEGSMPSIPSEFSFVDFARKIYSEMPNPTRFLLPALYGGALDQRHEQVRSYKILFVLIAPSVPFTERSCGSDRCHTVEDAIQNHRRIFLHWAYGSPETAYLFKSLCGEQNSNFYESVYVTDLYKDGVDRRSDTYKSKSPKQRTAHNKYWRSKLTVELRCVRAEHIVFVGTTLPDLVGSKLIEKFKPLNVPFPTWRIRDFDQFKRCVGSLRAQIRPRGN